MRPGERHGLKLLSDMPGALKLINCRPFGASACSESLGRAMFVDNNVHCGSETWIAYWCRVTFWTQEASALSGKC